VNTVPETPLFAQNLQSNTPDTVSVRPRRDLPSLGKRFNHHAFVEFIISRCYFEEYATYEETTLAHRAGIF
jgi:hypothetical protein